jgi:DNA-binding GntR family transcriptional regulator
MKTEQKIPRKTFNDLIYHQMEENLMSGQYKPDQLITLRELSASFGVSIIPVREALLLMEAEGIIRRRSNRDYHIRSLSYREFLDIYEIRKCLETEVAVFAIEKAGEEDDVHMKQLFADMIEAHDDVNAYMYRHYQFHISLYRIADRPIYDELIHTLWLRVGPYITIMGEAIGIDDSIIHHRLVLQAFLDRDKDAIVSLLQKDLQAGIAALDKDDFNTDEIFTT